MIAAQVLDHPPLVLSQREREGYFEDGFLIVPGYVGAPWLARLRAVVTAKIDESRPLTESDDQFDLAPEHSAEKPGIRRLRKAVDRHPDLWAFATDAAVVDLVADLLGPDVAHRGPLFEHLDDDGRWPGAIAPRDVATLPVPTDSSADTLPFTPAPTPTSHTGTIVRGGEAPHVHMEPYPAKLPPRWDRVGYRSIFTAQAGGGRPAYGD
jgi:hypothetical protein